MSLREQVERVARPLEEVGERLVVERSPRVEQLRLVVAVALVQFPGGLGANEFVERAHLGVNCWI